MSDIMFVLLALLAIAIGFVVMVQLDKYLYRTGVRKNNAKSTVRISVKDKKEKPVEFIVGSKECSCRI